MSWVWVAVFFIRNQVIVIAQEIQETIYEEIGPEMVDYITSPEALLNPYCEVSYLLTPYHMLRGQSETELAQLYVTIKENLSVPYNCQGYFENVDTYWGVAFFGVMPPAGAEELLRTALETGGAELDDHWRDLAAGIYALVYAMNPTEAATHFARAYAKAPTEFAVARWWAIINALAGNLDQAFAALDQMTILASLDPSLPLYRSLIAYKAGRYEPAYDAAMEAVGNNDGAIALTLAGKALLQLDRPAEAIELLEQAVRLGPAAQEPLAYLSYAYAQNGDLRAARELAARLRYGR